MFKNNTLILFLFFLLLTSQALAQGLAPYPSPEGMAAEVRELAASDPGRVEVMVIGKSAGGRDILCLKIHAGDGKDRPAALIAGAIHGDEYIANRTAMAAARMLVKGSDPAARQVLSEMDVYVLPLVNPDGYETTWESGGDLPPKQTRTNGAGVDLNRNFGKPPVRIDMPLGYSGKTDPASDRFVGPAPFSEPEARAVQKLAQDTRFFAAVDFHCAAGMVIPVLCDDRFSQRGLRKMAMAYRKAQDDKYLIAMFPWWMPMYQGSMEECLYRETGALAILIELGKSSDFDREKKKLNHFWAFNPAGEDVIDRVANDNARAALQALLAAYDYTGGRTGPHPVGLE